MPISPPLNTAGILPPAYPNDPPTVEDSLAATEYHRKLRLSYENASVSGALAATAKEVLAAKEYDMAITVARVFAAGEVAPLWFGPVQARLDEMDQRLRILENRERGNGTEIPFNEIRFSQNAPKNANVYPTTLGLPLLNNIHTIAALTDAELETYCEGYDIRNTSVEDEDGFSKRIRIATYIGCKDMKALVR